MNEQGRTGRRGRTTEGEVGLAKAPYLERGPEGLGQEKPDQKAWAVGMARYGAGYVWTMPDVGMAMQVYDETTFRLLTLIEHDYFIEAAALVKATAGERGPPTRRESGRHGGVHPPGRMARRTDARRAKDWPWRWSECART